MERRTGARLLWQKVMLVLLYVFLWFPIVYIIYLSVARNSVWPFPPEFTLDWYRRLWIMSDFHVGLVNSVLIAAGTGAIAMVLSMMAAWGLMKYRFRFKGFYISIYLLPMFIAHILIGVSTLMFNRNVLHIQANIYSAIVANATYGISFGLLIILAQLIRYNWQLDEVASVFGAKPWRSFVEVTLPTIWPALFGAFLVSFILSFNNFDVSFYNLGATPTLPTVTWGTLRHGIEPELYALSSLIIAFVLLVLAVLYFLIRFGWVRIGIPEK